QIAKPVKGIVGVSVLGLEDNDTLTFNGSARLVMQSVMKFPIALAVLHRVDSLNLSLEQSTVSVGKKDFAKDSKGNLHEKYPKGGNISIGELITYMVSHSDND